MSLFTNDLYCPIGYREYRGYQFIWAFSNFFFCDMQGHFLTLPTYKRTFSFDMELLTEVWKFHGKEKKFTKYQSLRVRTELFHLTWNYLKRFGNSVAKKKKVHKIPITSCQNQFNIVLSYKAEITYFKNYIYLFFSVLLYNFLVIFCYRKQKCIHVKRICMGHSQPNFVMFQKYI